MAQIFVGILPKVAQVHFSIHSVFSLWEIALDEEAADRQIIPIFLNADGIYRPAASKRIWEELLKPECKIESRSTRPISGDEYAALEQRAQELATDAFVQLRTSYEQRHETEYRKRQRALTLRIEAARRIGIENIRNTRIARLESELQEETAAYARHREICPRFTPIIAIKTE